MWGVFAFGSWMLSIGIQPPCPILCHALELQNTCWGKDTACSCHACHACGRPGSNTCTALETWQIRLPDYTIQITTEWRHVVSLQQADIRVIRVTQCLKKTSGWVRENFMEIYVESPKTWKEDPQFPSLVAHLVPCANTWEAGTIYKCTCWWHQ